MRPENSFDGRWLAAGLLGIYFLLLWLSGPAGELSSRWRRAGVYAYPPPFIDLQVFPAARATVAGGAELYGPSLADPMHRPYNYPRVWLTFMRFPADADWLRPLGVMLAAAAVLALLAFWGRLSPGEGLIAGLLLCSPAFQLGVERGNTDLAILVLVTAGLLLVREGNRWRLGGALWWTAAILKLYPILALGAWFGGSWRDWLRRVWLPLGLFAAYLALTWRDLLPVLQNTGGGWVQSYGSDVLAAAVAQMRIYQGADPAEAVSGPGLGRLLAAAGAGWMLFRGWWVTGSTGGRRAADGELPAAELRARLGFRVGALVYLGTFLAGSSFDYRQCFLLLTLPQLFAWRRETGRLPMIALAALLLSSGLNYLLAGWTGFFLNEAAGWLLFLLLAFLLAGTWRRTIPT